MSGSNELDKLKAASTLESAKKWKEEQAARTAEQVAFDNAENTMELVMEIRFKYEEVDGLQGLLQQAKDRLEEKTGKHIVEKIESHLESICESLMSSLGEEDIERVFEEHDRRKEDE